MTARQRGWLLPPAVLLMIAGILAGRNAESPLLPLLACIPAVAAVILLRGWFRYAACLVLCLAVGAFAGQHAWHPDLPAEGDYDVRGIVSDTVRHGNFGQIRVFLSDVSLNDRPFSAGAYWTFYLSGDEEDVPEGLAPGREVSFRASLYYPSGADNPDGYDFREELLRRGVTVCVYGRENLAVSAPSTFSFSGAAASVRGAIAAKLVEVMGEESGGYTAALLLGEKSMIPSEDRASFARLGIAHILSVSGFHTGILVLLLSGLFRLLRLKQRLRLVLYGIILLLYCALCGMSQPVLRASLLLMLTLSGKLLNRPRVGLHLLCATMMVMLLISPAQLTGVSFQLTFGAMLGIVLLLPALDGLCPFRGKVSRRIWSALAVALAAQLGVLLPELYHYQELPLLSLLVNLPATFLATGLIALDWVILLLLPVPFLCALPAAAGSWLTSLMVSGVRTLSSVPGITLWTHASTVWTLLGMVPLWYAVCPLFRPSRRRRILCLTLGAAVVCVSLFPMPHGETEYIQFSDGNADAALLWDKDYVCVLDTGNDDGVLSGFLRRNRLTPDAVILTHLHTDHAGGLQSMLDDGIPIRLIYLPEGAESQDIREDLLLLLDGLRASGTEIRTLARGDTLPLPSGSLKVLWPEAGGTRRGQDANIYSLVSLISLQGVTLLHTGDLDGLYESYTAVPADLLKAAHHGSASSTSPEFLSAVNPEAILLTCSKADRHETFAVRTGGIPVWSTAVGGALTVRFTDGSFTVTPFLPQSQSGGS